MKRCGTPDGLLGLVAMALALGALIAWVPYDVESGVLEKLRRQVRIGDMMFPVVSLCVVMLGGIATLVAPQSDSARLRRANLHFVGRLVLVLALALFAMRGVGPIVVHSLGGGESYRVLRDEPPWKYIGFLVGGTALVAGLMALIEGRLSLRGFVTGLCCSLCLIAIYDLPFEDLLLPPNGDV